MVHVHCSILSLVMLDSTPEEDDPVMDPVVDASPFIALYMIAVLCIACLILKAFDVSPPCIWIGMSTVMILLDPGMFLTMCILMLLAATYEDVAIGVEWMFGWKISK